MSARTALGKTGAELGSYTEIVDFMRSYSPDPSHDFRELYRRLLFTILVSNKDDHLKNHGFLYVGAGQWRLSPVFDVNPTPDRNLPGRKMSRHHGAANLHRDTLS
ncbi:HipA domain-containing protein [Rhizobium sp. CNPSo 3968]|uniref:HipA domain-containing protein n=1 Tax=Rhizobium sp. CNPSo 3968 TaxID=3021408 RepID=UPI00254E259A|nr:HipA domain-containing protein [Rhizobium sp. CNPSo 3968]MDK4722907.1 HipA domain-containing protein [Rhizobium sp. CNPSo 3968]